MTLETRIMRRGLPRIPGGQPWPPEGSGPQCADAESFLDTECEATGTAHSTHDSHVSSNEVIPKSFTQRLRQGMPRHTDSPMWPPISEVVLSESSSFRSGAEDANVGPGDAHKASAKTESGSRAASTSTTNGQTRSVIGQSEVMLRRGLPRTAGGEPWPPEGYVPLFSEQEEQISATMADDADVLTTNAPGVSAEKSRSKGAAKSNTQEQPVQATQKALSTLQPQKMRSEAEPTSSTPQTQRKWFKTPALIALSALLGAALIVLAARGVTTLPGVPELLERYPGQYERPDFVSDGFPAWARWAHYLNFFFIVLIIRSGLMVRNQTKPPAFFTPKRGGKKVSIYLWMHTSLDLLWVLNGIIFVVLLFATGSWARIVPTSWEVFPNAVSAMLQYLTLQWPVEDGWSNYNSLQQLMYFTVVFIAAPLAMVSGVRMSEWWPEKNAKFNAIFPAPLARAIHYPVMLFFVLFIIFHIFLVFATGMLRNLNHMFYGVPEVSWTGFWIFALGLGVVIGAVVASKPVVLAPLASIFGKVTNR